MIWLQAKEKKGSAEDDKEVKGKDKEVRVELRVIMTELQDNNDNDRLRRGQEGFETTGNQNKASKRYHIPHRGTIINST